MLSVICNKYSQSVTTTLAQIHTNEYQQVGLHYLLTLL